MDWFEYKDEDDNKSSGKTLFKIEFVDGTVKEYEERHFTFALARAMCDKVDETDDCKFEDTMMESLLYLNSNYQWEYIIKKNRFTLGIH